MYGVRCTFLGNSLILFQFQMVYMEFTESSFYTHDLSTSREQNSSIHIQYRKLARLENFHWLSPSSWFAFPFRGSSFSRHSCPRLFDGGTADSCCPSPSCSFLLELLQALQKCLSHCNIADTPPGCSRLLTEAMLQRKQATIFSFHHLSTVAAAETAFLSASMEKTGVLLILFFT